MKTIKVSDATDRAIAGEAILPFRSTATHQPDGTWLVPVLDEVGDMLQRLRLVGESDDNAVMRVIRDDQGKKSN